MAEARRPRGTESRHGTAHGATAVEGVPSQSLLSLSLDAEAGNVLNMTGMCAARVAEVAEARRGHAEGQRAGKAQHMEL